jgi:hypothetical protein
MAHDLEKIFTVNVLPVCAVFFMQELYLKLFIIINFEQNNYSGRSKNKTVRRHFDTPIVLQEMLVHFGTKSWCFSFFVLFLSFFTYTVCHYIRRCAIDELLLRYKG